MSLYNHQLDTFVAVAEHGSFAKAADVLFISRTAVIQQVTLLERDLGCTLFTRSHKGVELTEAGSYLLPRARRLIDRCSQIVERCHSMKDRERVRIGLMKDDYIDLVLTHVVDRFVLAYPHVDVEYVNLAYADFFDGLRQGKFDVTAEYTASWTFNETHYRRAHLYDDVHCLEVPRGHPLAQKEIATLEDLENQLILMLARGISEVDDELRDYLEEHVPGVLFESLEGYDRSIAPRCSSQGAVFLHYASYRDCYRPLVSLALDIGFAPPVPIGFGYLEGAPKPVLDFIELAHDMREELARLFGPAAGEAAA